MKVFADLSNLSSSVLSIHSLLPLHLTLLPQVILNRIFLWLIFPIHPNALPSLASILLVSKSLHALVLQFLKTHVFLILKTHPSMKHTEFMTYPPPFKLNVDPYVHFLQLCSSLTFLCMVIDKPRTHHHPISTSTSTLNSDSGSDSEATLSLDHSHWHPWYHSCLHRFYYRYTFLPWHPNDLHSSLSCQERETLLLHLSAYVPSLSSHQVTLQTTQLEDLWFLSLLFRPPLHLRSLYVFNPEIEGGKGMEEWAVTWLVRSLVTTSTSLQHGTVWTPRLNLASIRWTHVTSLSLVGVHLDAMLVAPSLTHAWIHQCT
ncbi:hypothetical protein HMI55_004687, partial [Coelomomyces lativittatus]